MSCQLIGLARLGRDAEVRYTSSGEPVASLSLAFSYGRKGDDGKKPTQWVDAALWGRLAEALVPYMTKGTQVYVLLDDVHIETYRQRDGAQGVKLSGKVATIELASGQAAKSAQQESVTQQAKPAAAGSGFEDMEDDIPF